MRPKRFTSLDVGDTMRVLHVDNALCAFEAALADKGLYEWLAVDEYGQEAGVATVRSNCMGLSRYLQVAWEYASPLGYDSCFDFEFVPAMLVWLQERTAHAHQITHPLVAEAAKAVLADYLNSGA